MQQLRVPNREERYRFVIHDRDAICSKDVNLLLKTTGLQVSQCFLRTAQRYHSTGMFGLHNSAQRISRANDTEKLGGSLQSWASTFEPRTRNTGECHFSEH
jgi:hypothetical protein